MRLGPKPEVDEIPGQFWIDFIRDTAPVFRKPTIEQLGEFIAPTWQALVDGAKYVHPRLAEIIDELAPDVIVEDNVVGFPALAASGRPWVRIASCNPAEIKDPAVPPFSSGYPVADRGDWPAFLEEVERTHRDMWADFDAFSREHGDTGPAATARTAPTSSPNRRGSTCTATRPRPTTRASGRSRPTWHRLDSTRSGGRRDLGAARAPPQPGRRVDLPLAGQPRLGGRRPDAAPRRPAGDDRAPGHRLQGPAGRPDHPARQPGGRGLPAAAGDPARGSTWSSPTAATTPSPRRSTTASR